MQQQNNIEKSIFRLGLNQEKGLPDPNTYIRQFCYVPSYLLVLSSSDKEGGKTQKEMSKEMPKFDKGLEELANKIDKKITEMEIDDKDE